MLERLALRGTGPAARLAGWILCTWSRRGSAAATAGLVRLMAEARDPRVSAAAEATLAGAWGRDQATTNRIWDALTVAPQQASRFLLAPVPEAPHRPQVRLLATPPDDGRVLRAALTSPDPGFRAALAGVLRATAHPVLLADFAQALAHGRVRPGGRYETVDYPAVLDLALDNPHLREPAPSGPTGSGLAVVALLTGRTDLLDSYDPEHLVSTLVYLADRTVPAALVEAIHRWLCALGPGPGREKLCLLAVEGEAAALAAVRDSGQEPESPGLLLIFLFCTEQWERYDAVDPDGSLLEHHARRMLEDGDHLLEVARRNGRTGPEPGWFLFGGGGV